MNRSKVSIVMSQIIEKIEKIVGFCWAAFWGLGAMISIFDDKDDETWIMILAWVLCASGILLFLAGMKRTKMRLEFKKYVTHLSVDSSGVLENLASATGTSVEVVKKNLQFMIKKKFFTDAFINEQDNQLILPSMVQKSQQQVPSSQSAGTGGSAQAEMIACTCPCCGGMNRIAKGSTAECDFCGSPLS